MSKQAPLKEHQLVRLILTAATIITLVSMFVYAISKGTRNEVHIGPDESGVTGDTISMQSLRDIGQWEFLTINDEELADTSESRLLGSDRKLTRIYYGTLRLGIDTNEMSPSDVVLNGDTLDVKLPKVKLLDNDFIDEALTKSFYEKGTWDQSARKALYEKAHRQMIKRCMTEENLRTAEANATAEVHQLFHALGYNHFNVHF